MYLALLKEEQKELFLGLVFNIALVDGDYSDEEKLVIQSYCQEMKIVFNEEKLITSINELISRINLSCSMKEKKIIVFEAIGLAMSDGSYDESERKLIKLMTDIFGLGDEFIIECTAILNEYISLQGKINKLIID